MTAGRAGRAGFLVAMAAALATVTACGGPGGDPSPSSSQGAPKAGDGAVARTDAISALRVAQKETGGAESARIEGTMELGAAMSMKQSGVLGWGDGVTGEMEIVYTGGSMGEALKQSGGDGTVLARYFKEEYYANMGDGFAANAGGKHWIRYAYADLAEMGGASGEVMADQIQNGTPQQGVNALLAAGDVVEVGKEDVRGVATTHYSGTVDVTELATTNSDLGEDELAALRKQLSQSGVETETVDIWVDENNLLVKKVERADTANGEMNSTVYYSDYGTEVAAQRPAAGDTIDFRTLLKQQQGAAS
ncbi:hypothetical protein [Streptomyces nitrosporeus]|uniref:hypothetical protein n=1 Tax=Streptomyces nitrosporeus TaxID=28894 RepID=UPI0033349F82